MAIFLKILAILGIVLLSIIGFVLFLVLLVLFWPISYSSSGHKYGEELVIKVKVSWLLGFVRFLFEYPKPGQPQLKILFFNLLRKKKKKEDPEESENSQDSQDNAPESPDEQEITSDSPSDQPDSEPENESAAEAISDEEAESVSEVSEDTDDRTTAETTEPSKSFSEKIQDIFTKIHYKILSIYDMIKKIYSNIEFYLNLLQQRFTKEMLMQVKKRLILILKSIKPYKLKINAVYGSGEPDSTGKNYGYYCMVSPFLGKHVNIEPDFEQKILEGEYLVKGRIYLFKLAYQGIRLYFNKNTRKFLKTLKQGKS